MSQKLSGESFLAVLNKSGLIEPQRLHQLVDAYSAAGGDREDTGRLAEALVEKQAITRWQADKLLQGKHKGYFLGKYRLLSLLGRGGMSSVYLAEHVLMRRHCAIKVLPAKRVGDSSYLARFHREAQAVASLDHPNIVRAYDVDHQTDRDAEIHFLVMEYVEGLSLQELVAKQGPRSFSDSADFVRQAALGLAHAHKAGLVHRDIKPGNLLLDKRGTVKILDLGLARFFSADGDQEALTIQHDEKVLGTADYLAPEQALDSHSVDARADIYALGCTLYFLLTGHAPFTEGTLAQRLMAHQTKEPPDVVLDRPDMPASLQPILKKMMAKQRDDRFQTANDVSEMLLGWLCQNGDATWKTNHPELVQSRGHDSTKRAAPATARVVAPIAKPAAPVVAPTTPAPVAKPANPTAPEPVLPHITKRDEVTPSGSTALLSSGTPRPESGEILKSSDFAPESTASTAEPELAAFFAGLATPAAPSSPNLNSSSIHGGTGSSKLRSNAEESGSVVRPPPSTGVARDTAPAAIPEPPAVPAPVEVPSNSTPVDEPDVAVPEVVMEEEPVPIAPPTPPAAPSAAPGAPDFSFLTGATESEPEMSPPEIMIEPAPAIVIDTTPKKVVAPAKVVAKATAKATSQPARAVAKPVAAPVIPATPIAEPEVPQVTVTPDADIEELAVLEDAVVEEPVGELPTNTDSEDFEPELVEEEVTEAVAPAEPVADWSFAAPTEPSPMFDFAALGGVPAPNTAPEPAAVEATDDVPEVASPVSEEPGFPVDQGFTFEGGFPTGSVSAVRAGRSTVSRSAMPTKAKAPTKSDGSSRKKLLIGGGLAGGILIAVGLVFAFGGLGSKPAKTARTNKSAKSKSDEPAAEVDTTSTGTTTETPATKAANRPAPSAGWAQKRETTVGAGGEFSSLSAALTEVERNFDAKNRSDRFLIKVAAGTYSDRIQFSGKGWSKRDWGANVIIRGEGAVILAPSGADPVIRLNNVEGVQLSNITVNADGKPVAIELAESLDRCLLQNMKVEGFTETGLLLSGALGPSFSSDRVTLEGLSFQGASSAVGIRSKKGTQGDSVDSQNLLIRKCQFRGPLTAGLSISGQETRSFEVRECLFAETTAGIELVDGAAWTEFLFANNTFYKNSVAIRVAKLPAASSKGFSLRRNLFFESQTADVLIAEGLNDDVYKSQMLGTMFGNWTTRAEEEKPPAGHLVVWGGGQQGQTGIAFASTTPGDAKFLAPAANAPQANVPGQGSGEPAWVGAVGP
ncbi:protein kinase [bacterium]|nr:protein kinase [bacterium]